MEIALILSAIYENCWKNVRSTHVLGIQDSSEINLTAHKKRMSADDPDLGPMSRDKDTGFFCHPMLMLDADSKMPLGYSHVALKNREVGKKDKKSRRYQTLPIAEKESYRWIESVKESRSCLPPGVRMTVIADRESDIYEALCEIPDEWVDLLIRSKANRRLEKKILLQEHLLSLPAVHVHDLVIKGNHRRQNRTARVETRYGKVTLVKPRTVPGSYPATKTIWCILVREQASTVPANEKPIEWRLLTTHELKSVQDALQCIEWYKSRWYIEEIFRLVKSEGLNVEAAQLETGAAMKKLLLLALVAACNIMAMKLAYDRRDEENLASIVFSREQLELLQIMLPKLEGNTQKQKNPFKKRSFAWASWIIARLGGWSGYASQAKPGYITFRDGFKDFNSKFEAFQAFRDVYRE